MDPSHDIELITAWRRGSEPAFSELVERHGAAIKGYALRMLRNREQAEDVYADTFVRVAQSKGTWQDRGSVRSWLFTIAHRLCIDVIRKRRTVRDTSKQVLQLQLERGWTPSPEAAAALGERVAWLEHCLQTLPEESRQVVLLRLVHGLTGEECAQVLGLKRSQVDSKLSYARRLLRESLEQDERTQNVAGGRHER